MNWMELCEWDRLSQRLKARIVSAMQEREVWWNVQSAIKASTDTANTRFGVWADADGVYMEKAVDRIRNVPINAHCEGYALNGAFKLPGCSKD